VLAAAEYAEEAARATQSTTFTLDAPNEKLQAIRPGAAGQLVWSPGVGWEPAGPVDDPHRAFLELYLPICSATVGRPITVAHLGQSLDGFIATPSGESRWVTGHENILHVHRLRALCDAVVVGAGTVVADDPQLTTRLVSGPSPVRVILDPGRRLRNGHRVFNDRTAETLYVCARSLIRSGECYVGLAPIVGIDPSAEDGIDVCALIRLLHGRGWKRIFVEGGGVTVSTFLAAGLLDRLHVTIAPLLIGEGRPAIRLPPPSALVDCHRPQHRVFRTGTDVLFDCDLSRRADRGEPDQQPPIVRVI
jgi:riboflavin-specific deaminase-like protein